jgi:predicted flap endonuclease-1-like 5' DNA nuclease
MDTWVYYLLGFLLLLLILYLIWRFFLPKGQDAASMHTEMDAGKHSTTMHPADSGTAEHSYTVTDTRMDPVEELPGMLEDDLIIIEGIGPKIKGILAEAGITTFNQLAATDVTQLTMILEQAHLNYIDPASWPEQARLAARGDMAGLKAYQDILKGGRPA